MTNRRGRGPDPKEDPTHLSEAEVEARLGGGAGLGAPVPERVAPPTPQPASRVRTGRGEGGGAFLWRDVLLVLVLLGFLGAGAQLVLQRPTSAVGSPTPATSAVAIASPSEVPPTTTPAPTPSPTPIVVPTAVIGSLAPEVTPTPERTATPVPTPTLAPGATPKPTPKPTPGTAHLRVVLQVLNDDGGTRAPSYWTVTASGASASPSSFTGSVSGTVVSLRAGIHYAVSATDRYGYGASASSECSGTLTGGSSGLCTITEDDKPAGLTVSTKVVGGDGSVTSGDFTITVVAANASPGSHAGVLLGFRYTFDSGSGYYIATPTGPTGFAPSYSTGCTGTGLGGYTDICTVTLTAPPAAPVTGSTDPILAGGWMLVPIAGLRRLLDRRRRLP